VSSLSFSVLTAAGGSGCGAAWSTAAIAAALPSGGWGGPTTVLPLAARVLYDKRVRPAADDAQFER